MISPKLENFERAKQEIEPYDDIDQLRKINIGQRLANLRGQIYKNRVTLTSKTDSKINSRSGTTPKMANLSDKRKPKITAVNSNTFSDPRSSRVSKHSEDLAPVYPAAGF